MAKDPCDECHKDAECVEKKDEKDKKECICKKGFIGDGKMCIGKFIVERLWVHYQRIILHYLAIIGLMNRSKVKWL